MVFQQTWTRVSHYFEMWSAKRYVERLARSDAAQNNRQRENALLLAAPAQTTTVSSVELATQRTMVAAEIEEREQPVREHAKRLPSQIKLALEAALAVLAILVELRTGMWTAQGLTSEPMTIFLFGLLLASGIVTIVHLLMRAIRKPYDGTDERRWHIIGWTSLLTLLLLATSVLRLHDLHAQDGMMQIATIILIVLCSAAPAFLLDWLLRDMLPGFESWRQWRRAAAPIRARRDEQEGQLRQLEDAAQAAERRELDRVYLSGLYDRTYERERRRQVRAGA